MRIDFHGAISPQNARLLIHGLEPLQPMFIEEPLFPGNPGERRRDHSAARSLPCRKPGDLFPIETRAYSGRNSYMPSSHPMTRFLLALVAATTGFIAPAQPTPSDAHADLLPLPPADAVDFLRDVRPILSTHCFKCHGPDAKARKAGLRLDVREEALKPAKSGDRAIVPHQVDESSLTERVLSTDEDEVMPPPSAKIPLTPEQKDILQRWIAQGAEYRPHWAFVPPRRPPVPTLPSPVSTESTASSVGNPIDAFIRARLAREGIAPSPEADRATLIRRIYLDLIGLVPSPQEADAFIRDPEPEAYERLVDRLLASEHYGERWARRWMDLARYADTNGYEKDRPRSMWPWRDWLIHALNEDVPFDRFTIEQIAGDMLPDASSSQRIATGFHRNTMINEEGGVDPLEFRFHAMVDRVHTTATTWLGLTMACAQCHTHKYDPIEHREYFQFMAFLDNSDEPVMDVPDSGKAARRGEIEAKIAALEGELPLRFPPQENRILVTPTADRASAESGSNPTALSDGSFRFSGPVSDKDTYTFQFETALTNVTSLNLDALADDTLPSKGPGRTPHGNFVLSEIEITATPVNAPASTTPTTVRIASANADFSQDGFPVGNAFDGKPDTGWAIAGQGAWNINRHATFQFVEPAGFPEGTRFTIRLIQNHGAQHLIGRVRLAFGTEKDDPRPLERRRGENLARRFNDWQRREADRARAWIPLTPIRATSTIPVLAVQADASVLVSSDQTKSDTYELQFRSELRGITAIRLEVLPDARFPQNGPGRVYFEGPLGDFFLSTFTLRDGEHPLKLVRPSQTFASGANTAAKALDDDQQSGWSIDGGQGRRHVAVFNLETPIADASDLRLSMLFEKYYPAGLGRFRISVTTDPRGADAMALPDALETALSKPGVEPSEGDTRGLLQAFMQVAPELASEREAIGKLRRGMPAFPTTLVMQERPADNPRTTRLRTRGEFLQPAEPVTAALPAFLVASFVEQPTNRLQFARWLVSPSNPLTARVVMNRHWSAFFGHGLVRTTEDFGFQGELPSHPELLDWLAVEFMARGWSQKAMHRLIALSATYRQSSRVLPIHLEKDPQNRLLARGPRIRIEGEIVRDLALSASGLLSPKLGGPSVFPFQLPSITREGTYGPLEWKISEGEDRYRRGLYTFAKRTAPYATFQTFDAPSGEACVARREVSNTPLQSLTLLNDAAFMEAAQALGRLAAALDAPDEARAILLFRRTLVRAPEPAELKRLLDFLENQRSRIARGELKADDLAGFGEGPAAERAAWTALARALLNLDETVTRG